MNGNFACLGPEYESFYADNVAQVQQTFEHHIVEGLIFAFANVITSDVNLNAPLRIL